MQIYGYHRTSTKEQHLDRGIQEIERYCNEHEMALTNIFTDQETGKNFNRPRYTVLVEDVLRLGDILIVTELDRLGRNKHDTMQQIQRIKDMGVRLMVLELPTTLMDLSVMDNAMARMMLGIRISARIIIKKPIPITSVTGMMMPSLVCTVIPFFFTKESKCFL